MARTPPMSLTPSWECSFPCTRLVCENVTIIDGGLKIPHLMSQKHYDEGGTSGCLGNVPCCCFCCCFCFKRNFANFVADKREVTAALSSAPPPTWGGFRCSRSRCGGGGGTGLSPSREALLGSWPRGCCWGRPPGPSSLCGGRTARGGWRGSPPLCWSGLGLVQGRGRLIPLQPRAKRRTDSPASATKQCCRPVVSIITDLQTIQKRRYKK